MMLFATNQNVTTPRGPGVVQGRWDDGRLLVRLRIPGAAAPTCITPRALRSSLWLFAPAELAAREARSR